jgi:hypothetical protein
VKLNGLIFAVYLEGWPTFSVKIREEILFKPQNLPHHITHIHMKIHPLEACYCRTLLFAVWRSLIQTTAHVFVNCCSINNARLELQVIYYRVNLVLKIVSSLTRICLIRLWALMLTDGVLLCDYVTNSSAIHLFS